MTELTMTHKMEASHLEEVEKTASGQTRQPPTAPASDEQLHSFAKEILPYSGYVNHVSFLNTVFRPFVMLGSPAVLRASLSSQPASHGLSGSPLHFRRFSRPHHITFRSQ